MSFDQAVAIGLGILFLVITGAYTWLIARDRFPSRTDSRFWFILIALAFLTLLGPLCFGRGI
jgi:hypothetical protein